MVADVICSHRVGLDRRAFTQKLLAQQFREIVKEARGED